MILDTSVVIAAERKAFDLPRFVRTYSEGQVAISAITASELLHGYERAANLSTRSRRAAFIDRLLAEVPVLPFTLATAHHHARLWAELTRRGTLMGPHDLLIAATAVEAGYDIATLNRREFERVPGLALASVDGYGAP